MMLAVLAQAPEGRSYQLLRCRWLEEERARGREIRPSVGACLSELPIRCASGDG